MRINWGTSIVLAIIAFIAFILFFVIKMSTNSNYDHDLVVDDYYKSELAFQDEINKEQNLQSLSENIKVDVTEKGIFVIFPKELPSDAIKGQVFLYRPSNKKLDIEIPLSVSSNILFLPKKDLVDGRWNLIIDFTCNNVEYLFKQDLLL
ncbi:MAG: FixH family protein [Flavobacteriaceae bacterium]